MTDSNGTNSNKPSVDKMRALFTHLFVSLAQTFPARASEWALGAMLFGLSIVLASSPDILISNPIYSSLAAIARQETWAWMCLFAGGGRLIFLVINGAWRRTPHLRAFTAFLSGFFWLQLTVGFWSADAPSLSLAIYPILFFLDAFNVVRAMGDAGSADRMHNKVMQNAGTD